MFFPLFLEIKLFIYLFSQALMAEGRFYSDLELTEKEIERTVMEASRAEYMVHNNSKLKQQMGFRESTPGAEPSSSAATTGKKIPR